MEVYQAWILVIAVLSFLVTLARPLLKALKESSEFRGKVIEKLEQFEKVFEKDEHERGILRGQVNGLGKVVSAHTEQLEGLDKRVTTLEAK